MLLYGVPNLPRLLQAKFADLTELLSGDAVKEYPNLANIPSLSWKNCVYNGAIYGVPLPRAKIGTGPFIRADIAKKAGMSPQPKNFEEFHELAKAVTDPKQRRWAFSNASYPLTITRVMLNAPNGWRDDDGKLTHVNETDEQRKALEVAAQFWKEGLVHPDAFGAGVPFLEWFSAGTTVIQPDGYVSWFYSVKNNIRVPPAGVRRRGHAPHDQQVRRSHADVGGLRADHRAVPLRHRGTVDDLPARPPA